MSSTFTIHVCLKTTLWNRFFSPKQNYHFCFLSRKVSLFSIYLNLKFMGKEKFLLIHELPTYIYT